MNSKYLFSLLAVLVLFLLAYVGVAAAGLEFVFGIIIPYLALAVFVGGVVHRVMGWAASPVPFRITTTCGQQASLPWVTPNPFDNPSSRLGVIVRMALEVLAFRSLFRNTKNSMNRQAKLVYEWEIFLWLAALAFHYAFAVVLVRHLRFFLEPVPFPIKLLEIFDGFVQVGAPGVYISGIVLAAAVVYLFLRRILIPQVRYISLASDFFPLFLIFGIAFSGILMRYFMKVDVFNAKQLAMSLVMFQPAIPEGGLAPIFYVHLFLVCALLAYFPFSKLMHFGGVFLSPTRNLTGNTRAVRHVNPWNYPVKVHTYSEYEHEFRDKMIEAGLPVEKKE